MVGIRKKVFEKTEERWLSTFFFFNFFSFILALPGRDNPNLNRFGATKTPLLLCYFYYYYYQSHFLFKSTTRVSAQQ